MNDKQIKALARLCKTDRAFVRQHRNAIISLMVGEPVTNSPPAEPKA